MYIWLASHSQISASFVLRLKVCTTSPSYRHILFLNFTLWRVHVFALARWRSEVDVKCVPLLMLPIFCRRIFLRIFLAPEFLLPLPQCYICGALARPFYGAGNETQLLIFGLAGTLPMDQCSTNMFLRDLEVFHFWILTFH